MAIRRTRLRSCSELNPSAISLLGDDILVEILIRLPNYKFAFRCKPVCKRWSSLISGPCFRSRFVSHHQSMGMDQLPTPLLHTDDASDPQSVIMSFIPSMPFRVRACFKVLDSFRDLLLCGFMDLDDASYRTAEDADRIKNFNELGRTYLVCNPVTKQWMALPLAPEKPVDYEAPVTRLVCEPISRNGSSDSNYRNHDLGDDQGLAFSYDYRFRVVCIYQHQECIKLDVFCSESGEWTKEALAFPGYRKLRHQNVCSCNGELFWLYGTAQEVHETRYEGRLRKCNPKLAVLNPFRLDVPATCIDVSAFAEKPQWDISVSQGALHIIELERRIRSARLRVWKLEKDQLSWRKQCALLLENKWWCKYKPGHCKILDLHPEMPESVFFRYIPDSGSDEILHCNLRTGQVGFFTDLRQLVPRWTPFKPRVFSWPTPIPRCKELRGMYDGSCRWFRAANSNFLNTDSEQQIINAVATIDAIRAATQTLKNDLVDKKELLPAPCLVEKRREYLDWVRTIDKELSELDSQREVMLSL